MKKNNKFLDFLDSLDQLPLLPGMNSLNIYHLKMLQIIKSHRPSRSHLIQDNYFKQLSPAQRYRYVKDLINLNFIENSNGNLKIKS